MRCYFKDAKLAITCSLAQINGSSLPSPPPVEFFT